MKTINTDISDEYWIVVAFVALAIFGYALGDMMDNFDELVDAAEAAARVPDAPWFGRAK